MEESTYTLSQTEKDELLKLIEISETESLVVKSMKTGSKKVNNKEKVAGTSNSKDQSETKKAEVINSKAGLEANFKTHVLGFEQVHIDRISIHKGIIDEKLNRRKIESLKSVLISQFDPKLSVVTVAPAVKTAAEYEKENPNVGYKVLEGRYMITAMQELYREGKTFIGLEPGKVMVVILNTPGVIAANYANLRQRHLSEKYMSQVKIQDFVKLLKRISDVIKDRNQALDIVKSNMICFDYHKDDITALGRISKWSDHSLQKLIEVFEFFENFQALDSSGRKKSHAKDMKLGKKLSVPKLTFHRIAKIEKENFLEMAQKVLDREISLAELATWSMNLNKLDDLRQQCLDIAQQVTGDDVGYKAFEDLEAKFPVEFNAEKLAYFSKSAKGETFKTGDRMRLERHVEDAISNNNVKSGTVEFHDMENVSSSLFNESNCIILNSKGLSVECLEYYLVKVSDSNSSLIILTKSQEEYHEAIEVSQTFKNKNYDNLQIITLVVKDPSVKYTGDTNLDSCGLVFVILTGYFTINIPPLQVFYVGLTYCLKEILKQVVPKVKKENLPAFVIFFMCAGWKCFLIEL